MSKVGCSGCAGDLTCSPRHVLWWRFCTKDCFVKFCNSGFMVRVFKYPYLFLWWAQSGKWGRFSRNFLRQPSYRKHQHSQAGD